MKDEKMRQQDVILRQLAQKVTDLIEPVTPYLVIGSKKAAEEARKKAGPEVWAVKKKLWEKLCSKERPELKEAAGDMVIAPSDPEVKQILFREILKSFEKDPYLEKEISSFIETEAIKKLVTEERPDGTSVQNSNDKARVFEEFNELLEKLIVIKSCVSSISAGSAINADSNTRNSEPSECGQEKEEILEKALDFACQIQYGDLRSQALSLVVPYLEGSKKGEYIKKVLYSASNIHDDAERARVFASLAPHLKGPGKGELIEDIFDFSPHIQYDDAKFQIFSSIVPHLGNIVNEVLLVKALEMAAGIQSEFLRVQAFSMLIPCLKGQRKKEIIEGALQLASSLKDKNVRPQALLFIVPHVGEARKKEILGKSFEIASGIKSEYRRS
ncbi:hypothetical protein [Methanosarcina sp. WWM596]|uniref:hypothetical protein n=2 Tax=unclassified Methanosarcina TaxID=2644672 RepID=UPI000615C79B|nr:hypothetical protein [Methanosarcina sp. WWM596]AKB18758.1 hypothetical protein MSWHS_1895 [Methanosarcina sp. WWM596]AKB21708.1 hypothetical protein MSWH1_1437 [Methanosarcina sp. WH1]